MGKYDKVKRKDETDNQYLDRTLGKQYLVSYEKLQSEIVSEEKLDDYLNCRVRETISNPKVERKVEWDEMKNGNTFSGNLGFSGPLAGLGNN